MSYSFASNTMREAEMRAAERVLRSGRLTMADNVKRFERALADWVDVDHAVMVSSGSSANLLMIDALLRRTSRHPPLQRGDEVLVSALAWPTTVWPIVQLGLVPVFVDADIETLAIDLDNARAATGPRTRALFLVHVMGRAANMSEYVRFCEEFDLVLIEDACQSIGAHSGGKHAGTSGLLGSFSFYFSHHLCTIEGGALVTRDDALADDLRGARSHGGVRDRLDRRRWYEAAPEIDPRFLFVGSGFNVRPTEIHAAIGLVQLRRIDNMLTTREELVRKISDWVDSAAPWLRIVGAECLAEQTCHDRRARQHSWMTVPLMLEADSPVSRNVLAAHLEEAGVETRPVCAGNFARHPAARLFEYRVAQSLEACDQVFERGLLIGCHPTPDPTALRTLESALTSLRKL